MEANYDFYTDKWFIWQFYLRGPLLKQESLHFIARSFWSAFHERYMEQPFQIAGVEQAAIPILTAIVMTAPMLKINLHAFTVRKERKKFGLRNIIEGKPDPDLPVVFVDDLTSPTHATLWHWVRAINEARLSVYPHGFVVVYKGKHNDLRVLRTMHGTLGIESIYTLEDFNLTYEEYEANRQRLGK
jgi:orotate phosphoribosyltransferase